MTQRLKNKWLDAFYNKLEELNMVAISGYQERRLKYLLREASKGNAKTKAELRHTLRKYGFNESVYKTGITANYISASITNIVLNREKSPIKELVGRDPNKTAKRVFTASKDINKKKVPEGLDAAAIYLISQGLNDYSKNALRDIKKDAVLMDKSVVDDVRGDIVDANKKKEKIDEKINKKWNTKKKDKKYTWTQARVRRTAQTQLHAQQENAKQTYSKQKGLKLKTWVSMRDSIVRTSHNKADGQTVNIDSHFILLGGKAKYPSDPALPPKERINCRCFVTYK